MAKVTGHFGAPVHLHYRVERPDPTNEPMDTSETGWKSVLMTRSDTQLAHRVTVENITHSSEYFVQAKETQSERYNITVTRDPILSHFQLKLNFPNIPNFRR